jgi:hypothetical protein
MFGKTYVINGVRITFWLDKSRWQWRISDAKKYYKKDEPLLVLTKGKGEAVQEFLKLVAQYAIDEKKEKKNPSEFLIQEPKW